MFMGTYPLRKTKFVVRQDFELSLNVLGDDYVTINMTVILITANFPLSGDRRARFLFSS